MAKTYREVLQGASSFLKEQQKDDYGIQYLFLQRKGWSKTDWLLQMNTPIDAADEAMIQADLEKLLQDVPPQYLLGYEEFYGHRFKVTKDTLIPRPETEELVELCLTENAEKGLQVVDIGSGTGAIAISLKLARPDWQVASIDISGAALQVAKENAKQLGAAVTFHEGDVLQPVRDQQIDLIISNPPYISAEEWPLMDASVRKFEPKSALFAEERGLAIYRKIAAEAPQVLKPTGKLYLEIGFQQGQAVNAIFAAAFPTKKVKVLKDLSQNDRMIVVH